MMEGAIRDVDARLVLPVAAERGHQRIAELLVEQGVDLKLVARALFCFAGRDARWALRARQISSKTWRSLARG